LDSGVGSSGVYGGGHLGGAGFAEHDAGGAGSARAHSGSAAAAAVSGYSQLFCHVSGVRLLVFAIVHHVGPFGWVMVGGRHIHHLVWGILLLLLVGYAELAEFGTGSTPGSIFASGLISICFGMGAALTLDKFALWLDLRAEAYWTREGRESIDAGVLFGAMLAIGAWGAPLWRNRKKALGTKLD